MKMKANATSGGGAFSPLQARALGIVVATPFALAAGPAVIPTMRFSAGALTGLIPGLDNYFLWRPSKSTMFNLGVKYVATPLGLINAYRMRAEIASLAGTAADEVTDHLDRTFIPGLEFGPFESTSGEDAAAPGHLKIRESTRRRSAPYIRRSSAPWCFTHKKRHWCRFTRKR